MSINSKDKNHLKAADEEAPINRLTCINSKDKNHLKAADEEAPINRLTSQRQQKRQ